MSSAPPYFPGRAPSSGIRLPDDEAYARDYFIYTAERLSLAANATEFQAIQIQADSDFLLAMLTGTVKNTDADEAAIANPAILISITVSSSGRFLTDRAVPWSSIVGTAERPYVLTTPKVFAANSQIEVTFTSQIGATKRVRLSLHGYKLFTGLPRSY